MWANGERGTVHYPHSMDKIAPRRLVRLVRWEREVESYLKHCESSVPCQLRWREREVCVNTVPRY